jgi:hypothetical protein
LSLVAATLCLNFVSLATRFSEQQGPNFLPIFNVGVDESIPTWYSSFVLLLCSILLAVIAIANKRNNGRYVVHWSVLAGIFLLMSIDEVAWIHETVGESLGTLLIRSIGAQQSGFLLYGWVLPAALFVLLVALTYLRFFVDLPMRTRRLFIVAGAIFVVGALGAEVASAQLVSLLNAGQRSLTANVIVLILLTAIEELLEMLGVLILVYALLRHIETHLKLKDILRYRRKSESVIPQE